MAKRIEKKCFLSDKRLCDETCMSFYGERNKPQCQLLFVAVEIGYLCGKIPSKKKIEDGQ